MTTLFNMGSSHVTQKRLYEGGLSLPGRLPWRDAKRLVVALYEGWRVDFARNACGFCPVTFGCICVHMTAFWLVQCAFFDSAFCFDFICHSFNAYAIRCIHKHLCIHSACYGVHSQYIQRTALLCIIMHLRFFAFLVVTFRCICMHSGLSAFSSCCIHVHSPAPIHSHTFREGCIITTVHSSYMYTHSMIVHFYRHALLCI